MSKRPNTGRVDRGSKTGGQQATNQGFIPVKKVSAPMKKSAPKRPAKK